MMLYENGLSDDATEEIIVAINQDYGAISAVSGRFWSYRMCSTITGSTGPAQLQNQQRKMACWERIAVSKQTERNKAVQRWSLATLSIATPRLPPSSATNVVKWPIASGHLTTRQIDITEAIPSRILKEIACNRWSSEEVLLSFIARATIAQHLTNPLSEPLFEQALWRARELDQHLKSTGRTIGPLHGLPVSLKDVIRVQGTPSTSGYIALANTPSETSDDIVLRLGAAGAIFFCKTNVPQTLMSGECNNHLYGRTSTPHNTNLSAGGSSGGEGALIALGGSPLGIGSDIAGSIRTPANFNGIYGLCPTFGRLPLHSPEHSHPYYLIRPVAGPMCRSVDGLEVYMRTLLAQRPWEWDFQCERIPWDEASYLEVGQRAKNGQLCIGFMANDGIVTPHPPIQRGMRMVKDALLNMGVRVVDVKLLNGSERIWDIMMKIFNATGGQQSRALLNKVSEPVAKETAMPAADDGLSVSDLYAQGKKLLEAKSLFHSKWHDTRHITGTGKPIDFLVLPSGGHVAPPHSTMEYFLYEAISNAFDMPCATIPVTSVDQTLDKNHSNFIPLSETDQSNWVKYSPELYADAPVCLQVMGQRFTEEGVLACLRVIDQALGRPVDYTF